MPPRGADGPGRAGRVALPDDAIQCSPCGGNIRVPLELREGGALVQVADRGIGLPADGAEAISRPFCRAANAARRSLPGMGLGLYPCRTIVERHGGRIWATSVGEDRGTTFGLWLPTSGAGPSLEWADE